jgi:rhamnosyltransferase
MRILGHIHTFNDEEVIERSLAALAAQTRPVDRILLVDNASRDGTLNKPFPAPVTVIRHQENLGTNGAVRTGFQYALEQGYDWVWVFDADTAPRPDALHRLMEYYEGLSQTDRTAVWLLSCLHVDPPGIVSCYASSFLTDRASPVPVGGRRPVEIDATIWSGSLYRMEAVRAVGLPSADYVLDWGEYEYGYRGTRQGYRAVMHPLSLVDHNIGGSPALRFSTYHIGPWPLRMRELPPIRCYYLVRNLLYFWFYEYHVRTLHTVLPCVVRVAKLVLSFGLRPMSHRQELAACCRGIVDGIGRRMERRYGA